MEKEFTFQNAKACKTAQELPQEYQNQIKKMRSELRSSQGPFAVTLYSKKGYIVLIARRCQNAWEDHRTGNRLNFGGGSYWTISVRKVQWSVKKDLMGKGFSLELTNGKRFGLFDDGTRIPETVKTKAEVIEVAKKCKAFDEALSKLNLL